VFATLERMDDENGTGRMVIQVWGEALRSPDLAEQITSRIRGVAKELIVVVERYQERGTISADVPAKYVARTIIALLPGFLVQRALLGDVTADMIRQGLHGLLGTAGE
jgi:TetR/AcrR family transcriptional regulator, transcriptional repressor of aconitase